MSLTFRQAINQMLHAFAATLANPKPINDHLVEIWANTLEGLNITPDELVFATRHVIATEQFFPAPSQVIRAIRPPEDEDMAAEAAWQQVRECLRRCGCYASLAAADVGGDGAALWALARVGWQRLGETLTEENRAILRAEFVRVYLMARREKETLAYLAGHYELVNGAQNRELSPALVGRPDWPCLPGEERMLPAPAILDALAGGRR